MHKSIVLFLLITLSRAWLVHGQVRGDSIFDGANGGTNGKPSVLSDAAKTNSVRSSHPNSVADGALIGFDRLSGFPFQLSDDLVSNTNAAKANGQVNAMIPEDIRALDHHTVLVEGFMVPLDYEKDKVVEFILVQDPFGCCYGSPPQIHELIKVRVKSPGVSAIMDGPARARGMLHVGAERENGFLSSIYRMDAENLSAKP
jgi:hypothetical protein